MAGELSLKTPLTGLVTLVPTNTATDKTITLPATTGTMVVQDATNTTTITNLAYTGTLTGGTGVVNIGSGQVYKASGGNVGIGTTSPQAKLAVSNGGAAGLEFFVNYPGGGVGTYIQSYNRSSPGYVNTAYDAADHSFRISGTEKMFLNSSGNLGIGTGSPNQRLQVTGSNSTGFAGATLQNSNGNVGLAGVQFSSDTTYSKAAIAQVRENPNGAGPLVFYVDSATDAADWSASDEKMRISAAGNVGIGTVSPGTKLEVTGDITQTWAASMDRFVGSKFSTSYELGLHFIESSRETRIVSKAADSTGLISFYTGVTPTEKMRLTTDGNLLVGATNQVTAGGVIRTVSKDGTWPLVVHDVFANNLAVAFVASNNAQVGSITVTTSATTYATSSDYRLKENVAPMTGALATVAALNPVTYTWKADGSAGQGFIAHELQAVVPDCVTGEKDAVDKDGKPQYQGVDTSFLVATLTAAIQELTARLEVLENK